jgi:ketosteroid isomerase-like protein
VAALFGDDIAFRRDGLSVDRAGLPMLGLALRHMGAGSPVLHRLRLDLSLPTTGRRALVASVRRLRKRQGPLDQGADMSDQAKAMEPEAVTRLIVERLNAGDAAGVAALYEPEAVLAYPADRPTMGRAAIQAVYQQMVDAGMRFGAETPLPTVRFQDLALTSTRSADNTGVRVQLLRRQPDGSWLRIIDRPEVPQP